MEPPAAALPIPGNGDYGKRFRRPGCNLCRHLRPNMDLLPDEEEKSENACAACYALQKEDYDLVTLDCLPGIKLDGGCGIYGRRRGASVDDCHAVISRAPEQVRAFCCEHGFPSCRFDALPQ